MWQTRWAFTLLAVIAGAVAACSPEYTRTPDRGPTLHPTPVGELLERAAALSLSLQQLEAQYWAQVAPVEEILLQHTNDQSVAKRVALALHREAGRLGLDSWLLLGVMLVENPWIDSTATSPVGARGLMQVMPFHVGRWPECTGSLVEIESNICYGSTILAHYLTEERGNLPRALLRYNGCVRGTNTPNCHEYPSWVAMRFMLAWDKRSRAERAKERM